MFNPTCKYQILPSLFCKDASDNSCQPNIRYSSSMDSLKMILSNIQIISTRLPEYHKKDKNSRNLINTWFY